MKTAERISGNGTGWPLAGLVAAAALLGAGLAGWLDKGAAIFLAMAESGLSWCF
ncbi:MAG: hypothetical protein K8H74_10570 [Notoacmeibacter sp.]|nr:hypothetical protein [Notoacmeibacter sp.]